MIWRSCGDARRCNAIAVPLPSETRKVSLEHPWLGNAHRKLSPACSRGDRVIGPSSRTHALSGEVRSGRIEKITGLKYKQSVRARSTRRLKRWFWPAVTWKKMDSISPAFQLFQMLKSMGRPALPLSCMLRSIPPLPISRLFRSKYMQFGAKLYHGRSKLDRKNFAYF